MNKFMRTELRNFLTSRIEGLKLDLEVFYEENSIPRNVTLKLNNSCIQFNVLLPKVLIGRIKSAIVNKYIDSTEDISESIDEYLKDLEVKKGPLPLFPYNAPIQPKDRKKRTAGRSRKPFNDRADTLIRTMEKQLGNLYEEIEMIDRLRDEEEKKNG